MKNMNSKKGFTLIELLIVIAIIAILAVAFLPTLLGAPAKGRDTSRVSQVNKIQGFLLAQVLAGKSLPISGCIDPTKSASTGTAAGDAISKLIGDNIADFAGTFPVDPEADNQALGAGAGAGACKGQFGYVKFTQASPKYTAAVYVGVEVTDNANTQCSNVKGAVDPIIVKGSAVVPTTTDGACYIAPIQ